MVIQNVDVGDCDRPARPTVLAMARWVMTDSAILQDAPPPPPAASIWRLTAKRVNPLVVLNAGRLDPHVYCIHPLTGDVIGLGGFAAHFGERRLHAIQVPKDQLNGAFASSIEAIATRYVDLVTRHQPEGPIHLVGWSAGAVIALDMARQLRDLGRTVPLIAALDAAPRNTGAGWTIWDPRYLLALAVNAPRWIRDDANQGWSVRSMIDRVERKLAYRFGIGASPRPISRAGHGAGDTGARTADTDWHLDHNAFIHAMYKAMVDYVPRAYDGPVVVYETKTQPLIRLRQVAAAWRAIARDTEVVSIAGNHTGMVNDPAIGVIARHFLHRLG